MKNYDDWSMERIIESFNLRHANSIPELRMTHVGDAHEELLRHYRKEVGIQKRYGGIRNPASVLTNKIRHEFTNYDEIRDELTSMSKQGYLDQCEEMEIRLELLSKVGELTENIIYRLPQKIDLSEFGGGVVFRQELSRSNQNYFKKESRIINDGIRRNCGK